MATFLALLAILLAAGIYVERERAGPGRNGVTLDAALVLPERNPKTPPIVALHGCGVPLPAPRRPMGDSAGKIWPPVLQQDGFGSRGPGPRTPRSAR
jgi:hypothetical protein